MTLEEKAGLMLIDTLNAACDPATRAGPSRPPPLRLRQNQKMHRFIFRNTVTSPDKAVCGGSGGGFAASTSVTPRRRWRT